MQDRGKDSGGHCIKGFVCVDTSDIELQEELHDDAEKDPEGRLVVVALIAQKLLKLSRQVITAWHVVLGCLVVTLLEHAHVRGRLRVTFDGSIVKFLPAADFVS